MTRPPIKLHNGLSVPERVISKVNESHQPGLTPSWLTSLPTVIETICVKWEIELELMAADTYMTLVVFGQSTALGAVVIKSSPASADLLAQVRALEIGSGANLPRIYDVDYDQSVIVMERIVPGTELRHAGMDDETSTRLAAETLIPLWRPVSGGNGLKLQRDVLQPLLDWEPRTGLIDPALVTQAQELAASLLKDSSSLRLLHGDLHHWNVLQRGSAEWVMIDPVGVVGDPALDVARWMHNPPEIATRHDLGELLLRRFRIWEDVTRIDQRRLASWAFVGNVLNAINCKEFAPDVMRSCIAVAGGIRTLMHS
jgi:streptomycin 6-kinase